ncbi:hypothetical protein GCM10009731_66740 [Streptomyces globosus]
MKFMSKIVDNYDDESGHSRAPSHDAAAHGVDELVSDRAPRMPEGMSKSLTRASCVPGTDQTWVYILLGVANAEPQAYPRSSGP